MKAKALLFIVIILLASPAWAADFFEKGDIVRVALANPEDDGSSTEITGVMVKQTSSIVTISVYPKKETVIRYRTPYSVYFEVLDCCDPPPEIFRPADVGEYYTASGTIVNKCKIEPVKDNSKPELIVFHSDCEITEENADKIELIRGVETTILINRYNIHVYKGLLFDWESIQDKIVTILREGE